jgi:hypothetical protein
LENSFSNLSLSLAGANARTCSKALHRPILDQQYYAIGLT